MWLSVGSHAKPKRSTYRSARSVQRRRVIQDPDQFSGIKLGLLCLGAFVFAWAIVIPAVLLEYASNNTNPQGEQVRHPGALLEDSHWAKSQWHLLQKKSQQAEDAVSDFLSRHSPKDVLFRKPVEDSQLEQEPINHDKLNSANAVDPDATHQDQQEEDLARGAAGLPMRQTPALIGAKRGTIQCDVNVNDLAYWNQPQGTRDLEFSSPYKSPKEKFLTFEADLGGWNNIRMSMEVIFVMAHAMGRTLVLPPSAPFYLLGHGKEGAKSFGNFFPMHLFQGRLKIISMHDFLKMHGSRLFDMDPAHVEELLPIADVCVYQSGDPRSCDILHTELRKHGMQPPLQGNENCLVFDQEHFQHNTTSTDVEKRVARFCGVRKPVYYGDSMHTAEWIHWNAGCFEYRLLNHFYSFVYFTNPIIDNYYKRFVRDFLHYTDEIYCAAGKIVHALQENENGFSTLHIRRGDFQFKETRLSNEEWYNNTKEIWKPNELLYIATDERNKTWFEPFAKNHPVKFLDDYWDLAGLATVDKSYLGMIDTIVASHGRAFAGTWFSSFTGYINRMRGYNGKAMKNSWYAYLPRQERMHTWTFPEGNYPAREWPIGWVGIDGDVVLEQEREVPIDEPPKKEMQSGNQEEIDSSNKRPVDVPALSLLEQDVGFREARDLARGVAGLPLSQTPALEGASRGHIECDINVDSMAYWNDPQGRFDLDFESPFAVEGETKYITFTPDSGGWNNIRMSMEIIFIIAALSGRELVLPPEMNLYLLNKDKGKRHRGFADFFPLHTDEFQKRVKVITMEEFVSREGGKDGRLSIPEESINNVTKAAKACVNRKKSENFCGHLADYLTSVGHLPEFRAHDYCVVFDKDVYNGLQITGDNKAAVDQFCGHRHVAFWDEQFRDPVLVHFRAGEKKWRLLTHFYGMLFFTDPAIGNYFFRFVRDFLHYHDSIYCAAGKIVKALQLEGMNRGFSLGNEGGGGYSAMHIRRGDFQYKKVKLPAEEWYENTKEIWKPNEILFIATDERNKTWFEPIAKHHTVRFLDDYWDMAQLGDLDPNYMGMIDTIVASRARAFAGTWFSTFTGYINRMRGYHGMTMMDSWYSFLDRKTAVHKWKTDSDYAYAYEWPTGWVGIDGNEFPSRDKF